MMTDEAQPPSSSSSDTNIPPPEPDPPPNIMARMAASPSPSQASQSQPIRSGAQSTGTSEDNQSSSPNSTSPWLRWSRGLTSLLDDQQGRDLFETYLRQEGCSMQLNFLWACEGLKCTASEDPPKIPQLVRSIHRHFFKNSALLGLTDKTRSDLAQAIIDGRFGEFNLFDKAKEEVQTHMQDNLYPNFLKSEIYLCAVNGEDETSTNLQEQLELPRPAEAPPKSAPSSSRGGVGEEQTPSLSTPLVIDVEQKSGSEGQSPKIPSPPLSTAPNVLLPNQLQTVHEDAELNVLPQPGGHQRNSKEIRRLTKQALHMTEMERASVPVAPAGSSSKIWREGFPSHIHPKVTPTSTSAAPVHPYHAAYSSYNPVSRVDSEIQSMSSDAMTDDGAHSGHGHSSARKHGAPHHHPRSKGHQLPSSCSSHLPLHQAAHSSGDSRRQILRSGVRIDNQDNLPKYPHGAPGHVGQRGPSKELQDPAVFAAELFRRLEEVKRKREMNEKVQHKMAEVGDHAPHPMGASGGAVGGNGEEAKATNVLALAINRLQIQDPDGLPDDILDQHVSRVFRDITPDNRSPKLRSPTAGRRRGGPSIASMRPRRERDVASTFSGDSGNVRDYSCDTLPSVMPKSRSIPSELKMQDHGDFTSASMIGASQRGRFSRGVCGLGQGDSRNVPLALMTKRTSSEFLDSGISVLSGATPTVISATQPAPTLPCDRTDFRVNQWVQSVQQTTTSMTSPPMTRRTKKPLPMPPYTSAPTTPTLEEVRRRLTKNPQSIQVPVGPLSSSSTSGNPRHHSPPSSDESSSATNKEHSISSFVFYEETEVPYCVKIPCKTPSNRSGNGSPSTCGITLAVFKDHLPKRGNYRYFFKRECAEVYTKVVQEEITDDFQELPLFEGKIIAYLQAPVGTPSTSATMSILSEKM